MISSTFLAIRHTSEMSKNTDRDCVVVWFWGQAEFVKRNASAKWIEWLLLLWFEDQSPFISCSFVGDRLGQLRTDGPQMLHGRRSNPIGGAGPQHNGDWLVQALPYLLHGGPNDGAAHPPLLSDVPGEHHWALLWAILRLAPKYKVLLLRLRFHSRLNRILGQVFFINPVAPRPGQPGDDPPWSRYLLVSHSRARWQVRPLLGPNHSTHWKRTVILLIFYKTVSPRDLWEAHFFCCCNRPASQTRRNILLSSDLSDEKKKTKKTCLMRKLQRRPRLPTLITSYGDHNTRRARLRFSYAPSSQPTFDSHSQDCLFTRCVLIRGLDGSSVFSVESTSPEKESGTALVLFETPASHFAGAWGTAEDF